MPTTKTALDSTDIIKTVAPVTSNTRNVWQLLPHPSSEDFSDRVGEVVSAQDELAKQRKEEETPLWKRLLRNSAVGAGLGGTLASIKAIPLVHGFSPEAAAIGAGIGLAGSGGLTLARHLWKQPLKRRAEEQIASADPGVKFVTQNPKTRQEAREWEASQWSPYAGAEAGGIAGGLGTLGAMWAAGKTPGPGDSWKYGLGGAGAGMVLGHLLGRWHKNKKHKEFLEHTNRELSAMQNPRAQEASLEAEVEQQPMNKAAQVASTVPKPIASPKPVAPPLPPTVSAPPMVPQGVSAFDPAYRSSVNAQMDANAKAALPPKTFARNKIDRGVGDVEIEAGIAPPRATPTDISKLPGYRPQQAALPIRKTGEAISQDDLGTILKEAASMTGRGGSPVVSTNAGLMRGRGGKVDQFAARKGGLTKLNQSTLDMALDRAVGVYGLAEFCSDLEKLADDSQCVQNSDPNGDGPTDEQNSRDAAMVGAHIPVERDKAPKGTTEPSPVSDAETTSSPSQAASTDPSPSVKTSEETPKTLRRRAEAIVSNGKGVLAIKKTGYLLLPGGGVKEGETPEEAVRRETSEEAGRKLSYLSRKRPTVDTIFNPDKPCSPGYLGESTDFHFALDGGSDKTDHKDREDFTFIPFDEAIAFLLKCMKRDDADWAHANNAMRLFLITQARDEADGTRDDIDGAELAFDKEAAVKKADAAVYAPRNESVYFLPSGNLAVRRGKNRRYEFPTDIQGATAVPYEQPVIYAPEGGVPEPLVHGYKYHMHSAEGPLPEGFDEESPDSVLKNLYATLGNPKLRDFQSLDRSRARSIIRLLKTRSQPAPVEQV